MVKLRDRTGERYGKLLVIERDMSSVGRVKWICLCDCGNKKSVLGYNLTTGNSTSCGCEAIKIRTAASSELRKGKVRPTERFDITGQKFGLLTAIKPGTFKKKRTMWVFKCDCGRTIEADGNVVRYGKKQTCGCAWRRIAGNNRAVHGHTRDGKVTTEYSCWCNIKQRCYNPNDDSYPWYGGRGISVCDRWMVGEGGKTGFECFLEDMGYKPSPDLTIDRIDSNRDYEPGNCRWATWQEQADSKKAQKERELAD